ncbi:MAG: hypothetical protein GY787_18805 [Alteromonadales bacterium]|nr:hypothetical protein [Alteromonadales bacterium]
MSDIYALFDNADNVGVPNGEFSECDFIQHLQNESKICFFLGAGFSKSWNSNYPNGNELFAITKKQSEQLSFSFVSIAKSLGIDWMNIDNKEITWEEYEEMAGIFKKLKYQVDIYKKYPSLLPSFLDKFTVNELEAEFSLFVRQRIEDYVGKDEFRLTIDESKLKLAQKDILSFFIKLNIADKLSFITTNYDFVIDRLISKAKLSKHPVRGVYDKEKFKEDNWCPTSNELSLFKINGGFDIFPTSEKSGFEADYNKAIKGENPPKLIVPSMEQSYTDSYFKSVFLKSCNELRESDILIFIGYSLPVDDYIIRFLLSTFTDTADTKSKQIWIIDYGKEKAEEIAQKAKIAFPNLNISDAIKFYDGTFEEFCKNVARG